MILESAFLQVKPGESAAFETAFREAQALIATIPGYRNHELQRCVEREGHYLLLVHWDSVEAHEKGFRQSPQYAQWKRLLHHFYEPFPTVLHFEPVTGSPAPDTIAHRVAIALVERQLAAYNARDLDAFLACFSDEVQVFRAPALEPAIDGRKAFGDFYAAERFNRPGLRAEILGRIVSGSTVVDHERIHGVRDTPFEMVVAYEIEGGLIRRMRAWAAG